jgi:phosphotriesterase-related protein
MRMPRRAFVGGCAAVVIGGVRAAAREPAAVAVQTVLGPVSPETLGPTLVHEHLLVDVIGASQVSKDRYDREAVFARMLPLLEQFRADGGRTFVDATPQALGRDPELLKRLSQASGIAIITSTGIDGASGDKYVPDFARTESADALATRWIAEARDGIEGTTIRPGLIRIGVDGSPLSDLDRKLVLAAARAHRATGLPIASHTEGGAAVREQLDLLAKEGVAPDAFVWAHAQGETDRAVHRELATRGAWIEFDGISDQELDLHVDLVLDMRKHGLLGRTLVAHHVGWYHVGEPDGGDVRPYTMMFERFLPALRHAGMTPAEKRTLIVDNPRAVLVPRRV